VYLCDRDSSFSSQAFEHHLLRARKEYDVILIKAPPVLMLSDAARLARLSDTVMFLTHWRKTPSQMVTSAVRRLRDAGILISGVVLTNVDLHRYEAEHVQDPGYYLAKYQNFYASISSSASDHR
jgi:polysaccharide biosynthesis transport protein